MPSYKKVFAMLAKGGAGQRGMAAICGWVDNKKVMTVILRAAAGRAFSCRRPAWPLAESFTRSATCGSPTSSTTSCAAALPLCCRR